LLETAKNPARIAMAFVLRFLKLSGYSFVDYMASETYMVSKTEKEIIIKLASMSGEDVDYLDIKPELEEIVSKRVDGYLNMYLPRPLKTKKFLEQTA
jgi:hypothetical protein